MNKTNLPSETQFYPKILEGKRVCYGKEYRGIRENNTSDNRLVYEGGYWNGVRYGIGKSYDMNGDVEYEGEWIDNLPVNGLHNQSGFLEMEMTYFFPFLSRRL